MTELKPCPFCGCEAHINYAEPHTHSEQLKEMGLPDCEGKHFIECTGCSCAIACGNDRQEAILEWNKRFSSWDMLMEILNEHYPADIFNGSSGDPGPQIAVKIREINALRKG